MAISIVQAKATNGGESQTTPFGFSVSFSSLPGAGNAVMVAVADNGNINISAASDNQTGNTYNSVVSKQDSTAANTYAAILWCSSIGTPTGTFTVRVNPTINNGNQMAVLLLEVAGLGSAADQTGSANDGGTNPTSLTVNGAAQNAAANALAIYAMVLKGAAGNGAAFSAGATAGWTNTGIFSANNNGIGAILGYKILSALETTQAVSPTWPTGTPCAGVLATFDQAGSGSNTTLTPTVGSNNFTGNAPTVTPATNSVVTPFVARKSGLLEPDRRLLVPSRKIFLPPWVKRAA